VKSLYLTPKAIKVPMPTGEYGSIITWKFHGKTQAITKLYFEYIEDLWMATESNLMKLLSISLE